MLAPSSEAAGEGSSGEGVLGAGLVFSAEMRSCTDDGVRTSSGVAGPSYMREGCGVSIAEIASRIGTTALRTCHPAPAGL